MAAYHYEALRKQRVIDRKHEALARIRYKEEEERKYREELERAAMKKEEEEENRRLEREAHWRKRGKCRSSGYSKSDKQTQVNNHTQYDLRHQSKVLRDHGLVMGHVNDHA